MPIYTKKGDTGETSLPGKRRYQKTEPIFDLLGTLDQTSAVIGLAVAQIENDQHLTNLLIEVQRDLLSIGAAIASTEPDEQVSKLNLSKRVQPFEQIIDQWDKELPELKNFILAGGSQAGATIHLARTVARQAERNFHRMSGEHKNSEISIYLNRLSDLLFQAARHYNYLQNSPEQVWKFPNN